MATERDIVAFLQERHRPAAIIVVGSRADGVARPGSDWDLYVLREGRGADLGGAVPAPSVLGAELLDVGLVSLPIPDERILAVFGPNLQQARILLDDAEGVARRLCERAQQLYARGRGLSEAERSQRRHEMARNLSRMRSRSDQLGAFFEALTYFFYLAHRSWFEVLQDRWSLSVHRALPEIERSDPAFHGLLETLAGDSPREARIEAAAAIFAILFGEDGAEPASPPGA
jgi:hypothetical protein